MADLEPMFRNCWSDIQVTQWTNYAPMKTLEDVRQRAGMFTPQWLAAYERPDRYSWAITLKESGEAIGRMFGMHPDDRAQEVELAYELGRAFWGRGLMTEAAEAALDFFFQQVGMFRVYAYHASQNPASGRVMQKCGMRCEGTMKQACVCNAGRFDKVNYALLAEEWAQRGAPPTP